MKAGLIGCGNRGTGAAINFLDAGPNLEITALNDIFEHRIVNYQGNLIWQYVQKHINLVTAIRTDGHINETQNVCESNMIGIMGRESAYTGQEVTWDHMMNSNMKLGPTEYTMDPVDPEIVPKTHPVPGTAPA